MHEVLRKLSYNNGDVIIIFYSINDRNSLDNVLEKWKPEVDQNTCSERPVLLVGTKMDERTPEGDYDNARRITASALSTSEGRHVESKISAMAFLECSAKTGHNVGAVFETAAEIGLKFKRNRKKKKNGAGGKQS